MKWIFSILLAVMFVPCKSYHREIGKYVYRDIGQRLHVDKQHINDHGAGVEFVDTADLQVWHLDHVCPEVEDEELPKNLVNRVWKVIKVLIDKGW